MTASQQRATPAIGVLDGDSREHGGAALHRPLRSPVTWFGGKGHLARHIVPLLPPHECYVEPCCGAGAVFWWKPRVPLETINDLAGDVVQFYRVLRDPAAFERFRLLAELTPYAREEFEDCRRTCHDDEDPAARAWAWFVSVRQAFGGATGAAAGEATRTGWRYSVGAGTAAGTAAGGAARAMGSWGYNASNANGTRVSSAVRKYLSVVERLPEIHQRLQGVQIERGDWRRILAAYGHAGACVYMDPPYVWETRRGDKRYAHEMTMNDHHALTAALLASPAMVVLSGYRHAAVHGPLEEASWERTDMDVPISAARHREGLRRVESLWRNPAAVAAWERARVQPSLFDGCYGIEPAPQPGS